MRVPVAAAVVLLCVACAVPAGAAAAPSSTTTIDVYLEADGDARWDVSVRYPLGSEHERSAFRELGARFERGDADTTISVDPFRALATRASAETGRQMEIVDVDRTATTVNRSNGSIGFLSLTFRWTNFARVDGPAVTLGDVFVDGLEIESGQRLRIHPPSDYAIESLPPVEQEVIGGVVQWEGPVSFEPGEPGITYVTSPPETPTPTPTTTTTATTGTGLSEGWNLGMVLAGGFIGTAVAVAALGVYGRRTHGTAFGWLPRPDETDDDAGSVDMESAGDGGGGAAVDEELLSDEERVERLLRHNGGRMKQANIVSETGWSNAKVSQLLSAMAEEGRIEKLQIGRENLISLPDEE